jgi:hypothetical protein
MKNVILLLAMLSAVSSDSYAVVLRTDAEYLSKVTEFSYNPTKALGLVRERASKCGSGYFGSKPTAIIGDFYLFNVSDKSKIHLEGYYVNGFTGRVEIRESKTKIGPREKKVLTSVFTKINPCP